MSLIAAGIMIAGFQWLTLAGFVQSLVRRWAGWSPVLAVLHYGGTFIGIWWVVAHMKQDMTLLAIGYSIGTGLAIGGWALIRLRSHKQEV